MSLYLQNEQKVHLESLYSKSDEDFSEILRLITNKELLLNNNLGDDSESSLAHKSLLKLLVDLKRLNLSDKEVENQLKLLTKFSDNQIKLLTNYLSNNDDSGLNELLTSNEFYFRNLDWRVETKIASRFCDSLPVEPKVVIKFHVDKEKSLDHRESLSEPHQSETRKEILVQTNVNNLMNIIGKLEVAKNSVSIKKLKNS